MGHGLEPYAAILKALDERGIDPRAIYEGLPSSLRDSFDKLVRNQHKTSFIWLSPEIQKQEIAKFLVIVGKANLIAELLAGAKAKHDAAKRSHAAGQRPKRSGLRRTLILAAILSLFAAGFFLWRYREAVVRQVAGGRIRDSQTNSTPPLSPDDPRPPIADKASLPPTDDSDGFDNNTDASQSADMSMDTAPRVVETTQSVGDADRFSGQLAAYTRQHPDIPRSADYRRALAEALPLVRQIDGWNVLLNTWEKTDFSKLTRQGVREQIQKATVYLDPCGELPGADALRRHLDVVVAIANRFDPDGGSTITPLIERFCRPEMSLRYVLKMKNGRRYYFDERPVLQDGVYRIQAVVIPLPAPTRSVDLPRAELDDSASGRSPHAPVAVEIVAALSEVPDHGWEPSFLKAMRAIDQADSKFDPLLRFIWLKQVLVVGTTGSVPLGKAFHECSARLNALDIPQDLKWFDPDNDQANRLRGECERLLPELPNMRPAIESVDRAIEHFQVPERIQWVGWLHRGDDGQWKCLLRDEKNIADGRLLALSKSGPPDNRLSLEAIGDVKVGIAVLNAQDQKSVYQGQPAFMIAGLRP